MIRPVKVPTDEELNWKSPIWVYRFLLLYIDLVWILAIGSFLLAAAAFVLVLVR